MRGTAGTMLLRHLAIVTVILVGAVTTVGASAASTTGKPGKQLPFVGYVKGFVTPQFAPGFPFVRDTFGGRCSVPSDWIAVWSGVGVSTHTGVIHASGSDSTVSMSRPAISCTATA